MPTASGAPERASGASPAPSAPGPGARWRREFPGEERQLGVLRRWLAALLPPCPARDDVVTVADELGSNRSCSRDDGAPPCTHERVFRGRPEQVREARRFLAGVLADCPVTDDAVLCLSEFASNAVIHSASGHPGGTFTVRAELLAGDCVRIEVHDNGGRWIRRAQLDGRPHGLDIVASVAGESGTYGDPETGWVSWARLDWAGICGQPAPAGNRNGPTASASTLLPAGNQ